MPICSWNLWQQPVAHGDIFASKHCWFSHVRTSANISPRQERLRLGLHRQWVQSPSVNIVVRDNQWRLKRLSHSSPFVDMIPCSLGLGSIPSNRQCYTNNQWRVKELSYGAQFCFHVHVFSVTWSPSMGMSFWANTLVQEVLRYPLAILDSYVAQTIPKYSREK